MRAHYLASLEIQSSYILKDEAHHHLVSVTRIEKGEELLLLNGNGLSVLTIVESISKRELKLTFMSEKNHNRSFIFDLALGMPKREALELCLKEATELGFRKIYLIRSDYSQMKVPDKDRSEKLLISALEQSNAAFLPEIIESDWESINWTSYASAILMDSQTPKIDRTQKSDVMAPRLLVVGPEGGFSPEELKLLHSKESVKIVNLPTPILRTPTALATGAGIMLQSLLD